MGIDGIGKGGGVSGIVPGSTPHVGEAAKTGAAAEPFRVAKGADVERAEPLTLDRVRSGELSVFEYVDAKVHEATSHLVGRLTPEQLAFVQSNLREQMSTDPVLVDLVRAAAGAAPPRAE